MQPEERRITDFLVELSEDEDLLIRYQGNPEDVLAGSGLSERQKEVLRSGDLRRIQEAVRAENPGANVAWIVGIRMW